MADPSPRESAIELTQAERERHWPNCSPKDAATLILIDRSEREPRVLMGRRNDALKFMPGKFVFPGGRIEGGDRRMSAYGALSVAVEEKLRLRVRRDSAGRPRALVLSAIRETFEETGLALGTAIGGVPAKAPEGAWREYADLGLHPDLEAVQLIARAITPPRRPRRVDARFFAAEASAIGARAPRDIGPQSELVELAWVPLSQAQTLDLPSITVVVLRELALRMEAGFAPELPCPFFYERAGRWLREEL